MATISKVELAILIKQIKASPENCPGPNGGHVGDHLMTLYLETPYPTQQSQDN